MYAATLPKPETHLGTTAHLPSPQDYHGPSWKYTRPSAPAPASCPQALPDTACTLIRAQAAMAEERGPCGMWIAHTVQLVTDGDAYWKQLPVNLARGSTPKSPGYHQRPENCEETATPRKWVVKTACQRQRRKRRTCKPSEPAISSVPARQPSGPWQGCKAGAHPMTNKAHPKGPRAAPDTNNPRSNQPCRTA